MNGSAHDLVAALETTSTDIHDIIKQMDVDTASAHVKLASSSVSTRQHIYCSVDGLQCLSQAGAQDTIIVDGFEYLSSTFFQFVRSWKAQLGVFIGVNMYLTPTQEQGLLWHSDKSDVVAIQLEGIKQWSVCQRVLPNLNRDDLGELPPFTDEEARESKHLASVVKTCKVIELHPGDVLYMPAGVVHRAHAVERSLHATVSISRIHHEYTWAGILANGIANENISALASWVYGVAANHEALACMPHFFSGFKEESKKSMGEWNILRHATDLQNDLPMIEEELVSEFQQKIYPILLKVNEPRANLIKSMIIDKNVRPSFSAMIKVMRRLMQASFQPYELTPSSGDAEKKKVSNARKVAQRTAKENAKAVTLDTVVIRNKHVIALIDAKQRHIQHSLRAKPLKIPMKTWLPIIAYCLGEFTGAMGLSFVVGDIPLKIRSKQLEKLVRWLVKHRLLNVVVSDEEVPVAEEKVKQEELKEL